MSTPSRTKVQLLIIFSTYSGMHVRIGTYADELVGG